MGALHSGHLSLIRAARAECDLVVASIFVNPTQFGPNEDLAAYPRNENADLFALKAEGCDVAFLPSPETIYAGSSTVVRVDGVTTRYEGAFRPTHFQGVATVVTKLFGLVQPQRAYFGTKDLQQCSVVNRLVRDLFLPIELRFVETFREDSGLAMSSRNTYLSESERYHAAELYQTLWECCNRLAQAQEESFVASILADSGRFLTNSGFVVDYLDLVDPQTMEPVKSPCPGSRVVTAARLGKVRLLDNLSVFGEDLKFDA